ncbi:Mdm33 family-domain-containing protein [Melanogaster broomeanus]|nr:Mdm33 family-domain-containing protein [Melanogaster broomeanus]
MLRTTFHTERVATFRVFSSSCYRWQEPPVTSSRFNAITPSASRTSSRHDQLTSTTPGCASTSSLSSPPIANVANTTPETNEKRDSLNPQSPIVLRERVREWSVLASSSLRQHVDQLSKTATTTFSQFGLHLNRVTGYGEIEALKKQVVDRETRIKATRRAAREAKTAYDNAVLQRSISQREVNDLLQRKSSWTDTDVSNFTSLVRSDHSFEQDEALAKARVAETEDAVDREFSELMRAILARYHEEQVWSDKIRSASTYGSLAVLGINLVVFVMAIIVVEPWKRKKLAQTFERKVEEMGLETKALVDAGGARLEQRLAEHEKLLTELISRLSVETREGASVAAVDSVEAASATPALSEPSRLAQAHLLPPRLGVLGARELVLVAGSAVAGGAITLLARTLFGS